MDPQLKALEDAIVVINRAMAKMPLPCAGYDGTYGSYCGAYGSLIRAKAMLEDQIDEQYARLDKGDKG